MEKLVIIISLIVILLFLANGFYSIRTLRKIKKNKESLKKDSAEYHELNFRINTLIFSAGIIVSIGTFLGYNSYENVQQGVKFINNYKDSILNFGNKIDSLHHSLDSLSKEYRLSSRTYFFTIKNQRIRDGNYNSLDVIVKFEDYNLPKFKKPPIVLIIPQGYGYFSIRKVTMENFVFSYLPSVIDNETEKQLAKNFDFIIVEQL